MEEQITNAVFDDVARDAAVDLLEQFWILRDKEPEKYLQVRNREQARYFMRSFPRELESMQAPEDILAAEQPADQGLARRYKIYRQLLFGPVMYSAADPDFLYLRNRRNRIRDDKPGRPPG